MLSKYISHYLQNRPAFFSLIRPQEADLFEQNKKLIKSPILDLGCGDGFFAELVWGKNKIDVGLDLENERTKKIEQSGIYKKIKYFNGVNIPENNNNMQSVVSNCVLEHVESIDDLLNEVNRVIKPGGYFLTSVMCDKWEEFLLGTSFFGKFYKKFMRKKQVHINLFSRNKWKRVFEEAGFSVVEETGYLSKRTSRWMDIFHYLSFPELISQIIVGKWVIFPKLLASKFLVKKIAGLIDLPVPAGKSAAIFYVLQKK